MIYHTFTSSQRRPIAIRLSDSRARSEVELDPRIFRTADAFRSATFAKHSFKDGFVTKPSFVTSAFELILAALLLAFPVGIQAADQTAATGPVQSLGIEAEQFQFPGSWTIADTPQSSGGKCLTSGPVRAALPAATAIEIPGAGHYYLWVRAKDFPDDNPGTRKFTVTVGAQKSAEVFGASGKAGFTWERGGVFELRGGPVLLTIHALTQFARCDAVLLTTDATFIPSQPLGSGIRYRRVEPKVLVTQQEVDPLTASVVKETSGEPVARLENEFVRIEFVPAIRDGKPTVAPRVALKTGDQWAKAATDPASEIYAVVAAGAKSTLEPSHIYQKWQSSRQPERALTVEAGGVKVKTMRGGQEAIWNAGDLIRFLPRTARNEDHRVHLEFSRSPEGTLSAEWELRPGEHAARVQLNFIPAADGQFALGYHLFFRQPLSAVKEILLPMMWHRHRLPEQPRTLLDPYMPTPLSLVENADAGSARTWAIIADPKEIPFEWPGSVKPHFGLNIRDNAGAVQPSIYGPVPGTDAAKRKAGEPMRFAFRVLVQPGDWYAGYRTAAEEVFGLRDYRRNVGVSLTDAALNMIDLLKDDEHSGWWDRAKAFYQIESKNGSTLASPLTLPSLYRLTGDEDLYRRRVLPTMEFLLSRKSAHFSPLPEDTGPYEAGGMDGPVRTYATTTFGGFWELSQMRTSAFEAVAFPTTGVRGPGSLSHEQLFDEWLARYELIGDTNALTRARALADVYLAKQILQPPAKELGVEPFFFISFVPDWEGLLRLFEVTQERKYLDAAAFGARQLMTGIWTQPLVPEGEVTVHPGGQFVGDNFKSWRGADKYRLGTPRQPNDTPEHRAPAWVLSNVGLGFEQPSTIGGRGVGRLIYQMGWAPKFLRLAELTGDKLFETYARNAVIGRWANYPGYYATGFTDMPLNPRYPWGGPDVTDFYYHHIVVHLAWTIDYLVAEASLRSKGKVSFPSQREHGYAYFDSRLYGHAPGKIYESDNAWLWFRRGLITIDNPQLNYLTARSGKQLFLILMNENSLEEKAIIRFSANALKFNPEDVKEVAQIREGTAAQSLPLRGGSVHVAVPTRGLVILRLDGLKVDEPVQHLAAKPKAGPNPGYVTVKTDVGVEVRAAALQVLPGSWDAYVWCTASPQQARKLTLHYTTSNDWEKFKPLQILEYPFEFSVPVRDPGAAFRFYLVGETPDGKEFTTKEAVIGAMQ